MGTVFANCAAKGLLDKQILRRSGGRERNLMRWQGVGCCDLEIGCGGLCYDYGQVDANGSRGVSLG